MKPFPSGLTAYKQTLEFTQKTVPAGLLHAHRTKEGVWGKLIVLDGSITYRILEPEREEWVLTAGQYGVIEPTVLHEVVPHDGVRFFVEFHRAADTPQHPEP